VRPQLAPIYEDALMLKNKNVLVTGCAGFLGAWLCEELANVGAHVFGLDKAFPESSRIHRLAGRVETFLIDIRELEAVASIVRSKHIEVVYHLAAQALVGIAAQDPIGTFKDNVEGTWNVLEAVRQANLNEEKVKGVLVASSDKAYGDQIELPYLETAPMEGRYPYDVSKSCTDLIGQSYFHSFGLPLCIARCGNLYGGGDLHMSRIVPGTIYSIYKNEPPIIRSNGKFVRDYIYVQDAAEAYVTISQRLISDRSIAGELYNISNEAPVSVLEIVRKLQKIGGSTLEPIIQNIASLEIERQYLSSEKMRKTFGWQPRRTLDDGLQLAFNWYFQHFKDLDAKQEKAGLGAEASRRK
jgi:CDP-glucose 4,6-dehydratase